MDDMLNTIDTCRGCGDGAERASMRVGMGDCCAPAGRGLSLSEGQGDRFRERAGQHLASTARGGIGALDVWGRIN